ncbi:putative signal transducing protein [Sphingobacterium corticibacterium]|uniref:DUF2007 domain-containing protein n=1 Tax=Sphingobacterium corticibacterium TaxID=2484746 RepID=A0A4Q6XS46_9SPHI|nr:DUF2007 domain-containing protein [Sphingobacterium corticibacterium]RZF60332.1 DUF2007 domain-containing protein [Sphingobacterium corticibacterium]
MEKGWIKIQTYTDAIRGEMDKQMLAESGIPAVLLNKQDSSFMFGKIDLFVNEKDFELAQRLIQENGTEKDEN